MVGKSVIEPTPVCVVRLGTHTAVHMGRKSVEKYIVPDNGPLEWANQILDFPTSIIGRTITKPYNNVLYSGTVTDTDTGRAGL